MPYYIRAGEARKVAIPLKQGLIFNAVATRRRAGENVAIPLKQGLIFNYSLGMVHW